MDGRLRYRQLREYANRRNIHVRQIRRLRDRFDPLEGFDGEDFRLRFRFRKDSVIDLVKILDKDLQHQTRRGLPLTPMQQVLIALRFYATGTFERVVGDLFGVSVIAACTVIHKVSRAIAKQKGHFLSFPDNLTPSESFVMLRTFQVWSGPSIVPTLGSYVQTNKILWHLLTESSFTPSTSKQFVIAMPLLLTSWHAGLDRLTIHAFLRTAWSQRN